MRNIKTRIDIAIRNFNDFTNTNQIFCLSDDNTMDYIIQMEKIYGELIVLSKIYFQLYNRENYLLKEALSKLMNIRIQCVKILQQNNSWVIESKNRYIKNFVDINLNMSENIVNQSYIKIYDKLITDIRKLKSCSIDPFMFKKTFEELLLSIVHQNSIIASKLGYESFFEYRMSLMNIDTNMLLDLLGNVKKRIYCLSKYYNKKFEGLDSKIYSKRKEMSTDKYIISVDEALNIIKSCYKEEIPFVYGVIEKIIEDNLILCKSQRLINPYSIGSYNTDSYIFFSWERGSVQDLLNLVHEIGHATHHYFLRKREFFDSFCSPLISELVAITFEHILIKKLMETKKNFHYLNISEVFVENFESSVFKQIMILEFEMNLYRRTDFTEVKPSDIYKDLLQTYYPNFKISQKNSYEWINIPHIFKGFLTHNYAISKLLSIYYVHSPLIDVKMQLELLLTDRDYENNIFNSNDKFFDFSLNLFSSFVKKCI